MFHLRRCKLTILCLALAIGAWHGEGAAVPDDLIIRVEQKDWDVLDAMRNAGPDTIEALERLADSSDQEVRELVLWCFDEVGGEKARSVFLRALHDKNEDIRDRAIAFLHHHHGVSDLPILLREVGRHSDDYIREQAALIVGKIGESSSILALQRTDGPTQHRQVSRAIQLAMARLGDEQSRAVFFKDLESSQVKTLLQALKDFEYIRAPREAHRLAPALDDTRDAVNVGPSHQPYVIRVCDVTVNALDIVLRHPFPFQAGESRRYLNEELQVARELLRTRPR